MDARTSTTPAGVDRKLRLGLSSLRDLDTLVAGLTAGGGLVGLAVAGGRWPRRRLRREG